jgi:hypothetical protein
MLLVEACRQALLAVCIRQGNLIFVRISLLFGKNKLFLVLLLRRKLIINSCTPSLMLRYWHCNMPAQRHEVRGNSSEKKEVSIIFWFETQTSFASRMTIKIRIHSRI